MQEQNINAAGSNLDTDARQDGSAPSGVGRIYEMITERILDLMEQGTVPWRKPWRCDRNAGMPTNVISKERTKGDGSECPEVKRNCFNCRI